VNAKLPFKVVNAAPPVAKNNQLLFAIPTRPRAVASQLVLAFDATVKVVGAQQGYTTGPDVVLPLKWNDSMSPSRAEDEIASLPIVTRLKAAREAARLDALNSSSIDGRDAAGREIAKRVVMAAPADQAHSVLLADDHHPVAIVLDLVKPLGGRQVPCLLWWVTRTALGHTGRTWPGFRPRSFNRSAVSGPSITTVIAAIKFAALQTATIASAGFEIAAYQISSRSGACEFFIFTT
jgi:hypothetical protein